MVEKCAGHTTGPLSSNDLISRSTHQKKDANSHDIISIICIEYLMVSFEPGEREDRHTDVTNPAVPPQVPEGRQI